MHSFTAFFKKNGLRVAVSVVLVVVSTWYAVKDVHFTELLDALHDVKYIWVLASAPVILFSHWLRALRWKTMLEPVLKTKSLHNLFSAVMIGYFANNILPKGGEILRPLVFSKREGAPFSSVMATIFIERLIFDMIPVVLFISGAFLFQSKEISIAYPELGLGFLGSLTALITCAATVMIVLSAFPQWSEKILDKTVKKFSEKLYGKLHGIATSFSKGFAILTTPSQYLRVSIESLLIWFVYIIPMWMLFYAFPFGAAKSPGFEDAALIFVIGLISQFAPVPGGIGVYHTLVATSMVRLYGLRQEEALAYATVSHGINYLITFVIGSAYFLIENRGNTKLKNEVMSES